MKRIYTILNSDNDGEVTWNYISEKAYKDQLWTLACNAELDELFCVCETEEERDELEKEWKELLEKDDNEFIRRINRILNVGYIGVSYFSLDDLGENSDKIVHAMVQTAERLMLLA
jgi:hypothetical protein